MPVMRGRITVVALIVLMPHVVNGDCGCLWNLLRNFGPFGCRNLGVARRRLELGRGRPDAVCAGLKRIKGWIMERRGMLLELTV
jgi:hypothetical protein